MENHEPYDAASALDLVSASRAGLADRLVTPSWYHPCLGGLLGLFSASYALRSPVVTVVALALYLVGCLALVRAYRRATGVFVNGLRAGAASRWAAAGGAVSAAAILAGVALDRGLDWRWAPLAAGLVAAVATVVFGNRFDEALRAQLRRR